MDADVDAMRFGFVNPEFRLVFGEDESVILPEAAARHAIFEGFYQIGAVGPCGFENAFCFLGFEEMPFNDKADGAVPRFRRSIRFEKRDVYRFEAAQLRGFIDLHTAVHDTGFKTVLVGKAGDVRLKAEEEVYVRMGGCHRFAPFAV